MSEENNSVVENDTASVTEEVVTENSGTDTASVVTETVSTAKPVEAKSSGSTVSLSIATGKTVFNGPCPMCGAINCNSVFKNGLATCSTCKGTISA